MHQFAFPMELILTAIMSEIAARSTSFLIDKYLEMRAPSMKDERLRDLQRLLLRVRVIIDEADGRLITNRAMVHQLNIMRKEMYRGYFTLDYLRSGGNVSKDHEVSRSFARSKINPAKRLFLSAGDHIHLKKESDQVIQNLNNIITDASEFISFLKNYPPLYRQPYSMHLSIGNCMFGRQMEMERVMDFLMQKEHPSTKRVGVLPIVGPPFVGKSTLVAHVCNDKRVRDHFSEIVVVNGDNILNGSLLMVTSKDTRVILCENNVLVKNDRLIFIVEFSEDVNKVSWDKVLLYLSSTWGLATCCKIIIISRSNSVTKFGTTQALILNFLPQEAHWYFFKILTFGSADPSDHPKLESMAMEIARDMKGSFLSAYIKSSVLRNNFTTRFWCLCHAYFKEGINRNITLYGQNQYDLLLQNKPASFRNSKNELFVGGPIRSKLAEETTPPKTLHDVLSGSVNCEDAVEVLAWKSHIPPYKHYVIRCKIQEI